MKVATLGVPNLARARAQHRRLSGARTAPKSFRSVAAALPAATPAATFHAATAAGRCRPLGTGLSRRCSLGRCGAAQGGGGGDTHTPTHLRCNYRQRLGTNASSQNGNGANHMLPLSFHCFRFADSDYHGMNSVHGSHITGMPFYQPFNAGSLYIRSILTNAFLRILVGKTLPVLSTLSTSPASTCSQVACPFDPSQALHHRPITKSNILKAQP